MFWEKPKYRDSYLGEFAFSSGGWSVQVETEHGSVLASVSGDKHLLDPAALLQLKEILLNLNDHHSSALDAIHADEFAMSWLDGTNGVLEFSNICSSSVPGKFSLLFGLTEWRDATINVDFVQGRINEVWCND